MRWIHDSDIIKSPAHGCIEVYFFPPDNKTVLFEGMISSILATYQLKLAFELG